VLHCQKVVELFLQKVASAGTAASNSNDLIAFDIVARVEIVIAFVKVIMLYRCSSLFAVLLFAILTIHIEIYLCSKPGLRIHGFAINIQKILGHNPLE
jgi:hypothetical protein